MLSKDSSFMQQLDDNSGRDRLLDISSSHVLKGIDMKFQELYNSFLNNYKFDIKPI